jgi:hypothetical protein
MTSALAAELEHSRSADEGRAGTPRSCVVRGSPQTATAMSHRNSFVRPPTGSTPYPGCPRLVRRHLRRCPLSSEQQRSPSRDRVRGARSPRRFIRCTRLTPHASGITNDPGCAVDGGTSPRARLGKAGRGSSGGGRFGQRSMTGRISRLGRTPPWWTVVSTATMSSRASEEMTPPVLEFRS